MQGVSGPSWSRELVAQCVVWMLSWSGNCCNCLRQLCNLLVGKPYFYTSVPLTGQEEHKELKPMPAVPVLVHSLQAMSYSWAQAV